MGRLRPRAPGHRPPGNEQRGSWMVGGVTTFSTLQTLTEGRAEEGQMSV